MSRRRIRDKQHGAACVAAHSSSAAAARCRRAHRPRSPRLRAGGRSAAGATKNGRPSPKSRSIASRRTPMLRHPCPDRAPPAPGYSAGPRSSAAPGAPPAGRFAAPPPLRRRRPPTGRRRTRSATSSSSASCRKARRAASRATSCRASRTRSASSTEPTMSGQSQLDRRAATTRSSSPRRSATRRSARIWRGRSTSHKRRLADLEARRQDIIGSSGRSYQDDIIRELARNNCGANYVDMARRRDDGMWQDEESSRRQYLVASDVERRADLPDALRSPLRRLLFSGELLDAAEPLRARRGSVLRRSARRRPSCITTRTPADRWTSPSRSRHRKPTRSSSSRSAIARNTSAAARARRPNTCRPTAAHRPRRPRTLQRRHRPRSLDAPMRIPLPALRRDRRQLSRSRRRSTPAAGRRKPSLNRSRSSRLRFPDLARPHVMAAKAAMTIGTRCVRRACLRGEQARGRGPSAAKAP